MKKHSKSYRKLFKATLAATVATGAIVTTLPITTNAATISLKDLQVSQDYYNDVLNLLEKGIIKGFPDGTYKPYNAVTRGQAAKILAQVLELDTINVKNPGFTDVKETDEYYGAIAALAEAGIINGFPDKTFKQREPLKRSQMAKIIAIGFNLGEEEFTDKRFTDVVANASYAGYVQALLTNDITKGRTATTFGPFDNVLRGQMASFVVRSENAVNFESKVVNYTDDSIELTSGVFALPQGLEELFNESNKDALIGSVIKYAIKEDEISKVRSIEITSSGKSSDSLVVDGNGSTFTGDIKVNGDYITLKNLTIDGNLEIGKDVENNFSSNKVTVKGKTVISDKGATNRIAMKLNAFASNGPVASTVAANISGPTFEFTDSNLGNVSVSRGTGVNIGLRGSSKVTGFDFSSDTRLTADDGIKIPQVTISGNASQVTIDATVDNLSVNTNGNLTVDGTGSISNATVVSGGNISFQTEGKIGKINVQSTNTKIGLGENTRVGDITLPEGSKVEDVVQDYENTKENIEQIGGKDNPDVKPETPPASGGGGYVPTIPSDQSVANNVINLINNLPDIEVTQENLQSILAAFKPVINAYEKLSTKQVALIDFDSRVKLSTLNRNIQIEVGKKLIEDVTVSNADVELAYHAIVDESVIPSAGVTINGNGYSLDLNAKSPADSNNTAEGIYIGPNAEKVTIKDINIFTSKIRTSTGDEYRHINTDNLIEIYGDKATLDKVHVSNGAKAGIYVNNDGQGEIKVTFKNVTTLANGWNAGIGLVAQKEGDIINAYFDGASFGEYVGVYSDNDSENYTSNYAGKVNVTGLGDPFINPLDGKNNWGEDTSAYASAKFLKDLNSDEKWINITRDIIVAETVAPKSGVNINGNGWKLILNKESSKTNDTADGIHIANGITDVIIRNLTVTTTARDKEGKLLNTDNLIEIYGNAKFINVSAVDGNKAGFYVNHDGEKELEVIFQDVHTSGNGWNAGIGLVAQNEGATLNVSFSGKNTFKEYTGVYSDNTVDHAKYKGTVNVTGLGEKFINPLDKKDNWGLNTPAGASAKFLKDIETGGNIVLTSDIVVYQAVEIQTDTILDGNNHTLHIANGDAKNTGDSSAEGLYIAGDGVTIKNLKVTGTHGDNLIEVYGNDTSLVNVTATGGKKAGIYVNNNGAGAMVVNFENIKTSGNGWNAGIGLVARQDDDSINANFKGTHEFREDVGVYEDALFKDGINQYQGNITVDLGGYTPARNDRGQVFWLTPGQLSEYVEMENKDGVVVLSSALTIDGVTTNISLKDDLGNPVKFDLLFTEFTLTTTVGSFVNPNPMMDKITGKSSFPYGPLEGYTLELGNKQETILDSAFVNDATGEYNLIIEVMKDGFLLEKLEIQINLPLLQPNNS